MIHFTLSEFDSPDQIGSGSNMVQSFLDKLDLARGYANTAFKINSGFRTAHNNAVVGGKSTSSHLKGLACDIHCNDSTKRFLIISALIRAGFTRIGIAKTFIHVDFDLQKSQNVIWTYL